MIVGMLVQLANGAAATPTAGFVGRSGNDTIVNSSQPGGSVLIDGQNLVSEGARIDLHLMCACMPVVWVASRAGSALGSAVTGEWGRCMWAGYQTSCKSRASDSTKDPQRIRLSFGV